MSPNRNQWSDGYYRRQLRCREFTFAISKFFNRKYLLSKIISLGGKKGVGKFWLNIFYAFSNGCCDTKTLGICVNSFSCTVYVSKFNFQVSTLVSKSKIVISKCPKASFVLHRASVAQHAITHGNQCLAIFCFKQTGIFTKGKSDNSHIWI